MIVKIYIVMVLVVSSVYDWKYLSIPVWLLVLGIVGGIGGLISFGTRACGNEWEMVAAFIPGIIALFLAFVTRQQIGYGDGVLLLAMGGGLGFGKTLWAVYLALVAVFFVGIGLVITGKAKWDRKIPFAPYLALGSLLVVGGELFIG